MHVVSHTTTATAGTSTQGRPTGHRGAQRLSQHAQHKCCSHQARDPPKTGPFFSCLEARQPSAPPAQGHPHSSALPDLPVSETQICARTGQHGAQTPNPSDSIDCPTLAPGEEAAALVSSAPEDDFDTRTSTQISGRETGHSDHRHLSAPGSPHGSHPSHPPMQHFWRTKVLKHM